ncbi:hypothetical protein [Bradyrhizobium sp. Ai1a-2]|uniref:hypothetical protein n=1 Tax=Bradyrhizobium sp. Ai1a-2 TaxID=196490 RepID=UPI001267F216|nr:hypothetical protein [Bradyrhizobium sp. Ai1a-2]
MVDSTLHQRMAHIPQESSQRHCVGRVTGGAGCHVEPHLGIGSFLQLITTLHQIITRLGIVGQDAILGHFLVFGCELGASFANALATSSRHRRMPRSARVKPRVRRSAAE